MDTSKMNGSFRAIAVDGGLGETKTGKEQVAVLFEVTADGEFKGARLTWYGYFTDATVESTHKALRALGWAGSDLTELLDWKRAVPKSAEVELVVQPEQATNSDGSPAVDEQGSPIMRARVRWVNPVGKIGLKAALAPDKAAAFAARLKGRLLALDQSSHAPKANGAPAHRPSPPKSAAVDPGDIPF